MDVFAQLERYLVQIAGDRVWLRRHPLPAKRLPLFMRERYDFAEADLFGRRLLLAIEKQSMPDAAASQIAAELNQLRKAVGSEVALVLQPVPANVRNRLVHQLVPFIIPGTQMFLPMMMIDLREQYARRATLPLKRLSKVAQLIVLYHLVRQPLDQMPLAEIADRLGYSRMAISRAHQELGNAELCEIRRSGREVWLEFRGSREAIWKAAEPLLTSPVKKTHWINLRSHSKVLLPAGATALAKLTMLTEEGLPTFAIRERFVQEACSDETFILAPGRDEADARLEGWSYDPLLLASDRDTVDPGSLYLSLRASGDERIQKELRLLMERTFA